MVVNKQRVFVEEYLQCWNATEAARRAGYAHPNTQGPRLLVNVSIRELIDRRLREKQASADEALVIIAEQMRADIGVFYKIVEEWTFYPRPTDDIIDQKEVIVLDDDGNPTGEKKISYWVRHAAIDTDRLVDPQYSHLLKSFSDTDKGMKIEVADKLVAADKILRVAGKYTDRVDITSGGLTWADILGKARAQADKEDDSGGDPD
jgi:hypothetical protein